MAALDLVIRGNRVLAPAGEAAREVGVAAGRIAAVEPLGAGLNAAVVLDLAEDEVLLPGLVDTHVHVNDPGRTEWEGFASATRAAAAGGVTTIIDMPLNSIPPTVDVVALEVKRKTAEGQTWVDVGFWGGAVPGNLAELRPLHEEGVFGFKCFLLPSGVDEFPPLGMAELVHVMGEIASIGGLLIVHAEDAEAIERATAAGAVAGAQSRRYGDFLASRPREAENVAVAHVIDLARHTGCRAHILHVSSAEALPLIAAAKDEGVRVTAETCPHYLYIADEEVPEGATQFKCCPPIREADNRERLWDGLGDGILDVVVSDHSPSTPELKALDSGDFGRAWGGISSLQLGLAVVWTGARQRGFSLADVTHWMAEGPADLVGLPHKGRIAVGADADFCVLAPDDGFIVDAEQLHHRNPITPYDGRRLFGVVRATWLRGERIDLDAEARGRLLRRGES